LKCCRCTAFPAYRLPSPALPPHARIPRPCFLGSHLVYRHTFQHTHGWCLSPFCLRFRHQLQFLSLTSMVLLPLSPAFTIWTRFCFATTVHYLFYMPGSAVQQKLPLVLTYACKRVGLPFAILTTPACAHHSLPQPSHTFPVCAPANPRPAAVLGMPHHAAQLDCCRTSLTWIGGCFIFTGLDGFSILLCLQHTRGCGSFMAFTTFAACLFYSCLMFSPGPPVPTTLPPLHKRATLPR